MAFFHLELSVKSEIYVSKFQPRSMSYLLCTLPPQHTYIHKNTITRSYFHLLNFYSKSLYVVPYVDARGSLFLSLS